MQMQSREIKAGDFQAIGSPSHYLDYYMILTCWKECTRLSSSLAKLPRDKYPPAYLEHLWEALSVNLAGEKLQIIACHS